MNGCINPWSKQENENHSKHLTQRKLNTTGNIDDGKTETTHRGSWSYTEISNSRNPLTLPRLKGQKEEMLLPETKSRGHTMEAGIIASFSSVSWRHAGDTAAAKNHWILLLSHPPISYWCFLLVDSNQSLLTWKYGKHSLQWSTPLQKRAEQRKVRNGSKGKQAYDWHTVGRK